MEQNIFCDVLLLEMVKSDFILPAMSMKKIGS